MKLGMQPPTTTVAAIVRTALEEDLGRGDLTTDACVDASTQGAASMGARSVLVFCGAPVVREVARQVDALLCVEAVVHDGAQLSGGDIAMRLSGAARSLLAAERVALNFAQRLSSIATTTRRFVAELPQGSTTRVTDTRKTTPGLRALERYAVRCGGGHNHREDLGAAVLIKDNHIAASGSIARAISRAKAQAPHTGRVTCEVDSLEQLEQALSAGADVVMLDNFDDADVARGVQLVAGRALVEVSGNVDASRVATLARAGADIISVGALTHSPDRVDLGLDWEGA